MDSMRGADTALGAVIAPARRDRPAGPEDIAAEVLAGLDRGEELILPDPAAQAALRPQAAATGRPTTPRCGARRPGWTGGNDL